ncbi:MAG: hypothetical protein ACEQSH_00620 [Bacteroidia bacterium]
MGGTQLNLPTGTPLTAQFPRFRDVLTAAVYSHRGGLNAVANHTDQSPSDMQKRLASEAGDPRPMRESDILGIIEETRDARIIYWLVERYLQTPEARQQQAIDQIASLMPMLAQLVDQAGVGGPVAKGRRA